MSSKISRRKVLCAVATFLVTAFFTVSSASADWRDRWNDRRELRGELELFHSLLQKHPKMSTELQLNPQLAYNRRFLDKHDDLERFFQRYPAVQREVAENPGRVFGRYYRDDRRYSRDNRHYDRDVGRWGWGYR
jgi:hypothetical protein